MKANLGPFLAAIATEMQHTVHADADQLDARVAFGPQCEPVGEYEWPGETVGIAADRENDLVNRHVTRGFSELGSRSNQAHTRRERGQWGAAESWALGPRGLQRLYSRGIPRLFLQ